MDVSTAIRQRSSVRAYKDIDVEEEKLRKVLEAARLSPSASNRQEWKFIVVKKPETKMRLADAASGQFFIGGAPVIIVACAIDTEAVMLCGQPAYTVDLSIACAFTLLQAVELGLGTCWIGAFEEDQVKKILKIPKPVRVVALIPLGYPDQPASKRFRKSLDRIVCLEKYEAS